MTSKRKRGTFRSVVAILCAVVLSPGDILAHMSSSPQASQASSQSQAVKIAPEQLDRLVAPIALYPDPLLAQTLAASTYPLEIIQLQQWLNQDFGQKTLDEFKNMERFNPDKSWTPVPEQDE